MLYQKLRPRDFDMVLGNAGIISSLKRMLKSDDMPHAFLFYGNSGCGKTTLARILADKVGCKGADLEELNGADQRGIDDVRSIIDRANIFPMFGASRVFIIDEAHQQTSAAQHNLLKITEDVPKHCYFILCSTEPDKILKTIRNRCATFQVELLDDNDMTDLIDYALSEIDMDITDSVFEKLIISAEGSPRKALVLLEQILSVEKEEEQKQILMKGAMEAEVIDLCRALVQGRPWSVIARIIKGIPNPDAETIRRITLGYLKTVLLNSDGDDASNAARAISYMEGNTYDSGMSGLVGRLYYAMPLTNKEKRKYS